MAAPATNKTTSIIPEVGIAKMSHPAGLHKKIARPRGTALALDFSYGAPGRREVAPQKLTCPTCQARIGAGLVLTTLLR